MGWLRWGFLSLAAPITEAMAAAWLSASRVSSEASPPPEKPGLHLLAPTPEAPLPAGARSPPEPDGDGWRESLVLLSLSQIYTWCPAERFPTAEWTAVSSEGTPSVSMGGVGTTESAWASWVEGLAPRGERTVTLGRRFGVFFIARRAVWHTRRDGGEAERSDFRSLDEEFKKLLN